MLVIHTVNMIFRTIMVVTKIKKTHNSLQNIVKNLRRRTDNVLPCRLDYRSVNTHV